MKHMFNRHINNFDHQDFNLFIYNENADIGGGRLTKADIDKISEHPSEDQIKISGLSQETFEYFVNKYGLQFKRIFFWKNKNIKDLSPLSKLPQLEEIYFFFNQNVSKLWDMANNISLRTLCIDDFSKLHDLDNIDTAPRLVNFYRGDAIWNTAIIETLKPLEHSNIENLGLSCKKLVDDSIEPLINMKRLKNLYCQPNMFTTQQCAEFSIRRPDVKGYISDPYIDWGDYIRVVGKHKPMLKKPVDDKKLALYRDKWNTLQKDITEKLTT